MPESLAPADSTRAGDASLAALLLAIDPVGLGGVCLRGRAGDARDAWIRLLRDVLPETTRLRRLPAHITDDRLLGGLDLAATLAAGRPIVERGVLADADGGLLLLPLAERMSSATAARITAVLDNGEVAIERDGLTKRLPARFGVVALDEGIGDEEQMPTALLDRLACHVSLDAVGEGARADEIDRGFSAKDVVQARARLDDVAPEAGAIEALCGVAAALGIGSLNAPLLALRAARCIAALRGSNVVSDEDVAAAARLVLAPRATVIPMPPAEQDQAPQDEEQRTADGQERAGRSARTDDTGRGRVAGNGSRGGKGSDTARPLGAAHRSANLPHAKSGLRAHGTASADVTAWPARGDTAGRTARRLAAEHPRNTASRGALAAAEGPRPDAWK